MSAVTDTRAAGWMTALDLPTTEQAADAVAALAATSTTCAPASAALLDLIARAGEDGLLAYAAMAQNAVWQLVDGLDGVASDLLRASRGFDRG